MVRLWRFIPLVVSSLGSVPACTGASTAEIQLATEENPCEDEWKCGANSPVVDLAGLPMAFHDLDLRGGRNEVGLMIHGGDSPQIRVMDSPGVRGGVYRLAIDHGRIVARNGSTQVSGTALLHARIALDSPSKASVLELQIERVRIMSSPFPIAADPDPLEVYVLTWGQPGSGTFRNLCANVTHLQEVLEPLPDSWQFTELLGMRVDEALVFMGDIIDNKRKTMSQEPDPARLNIGCAGHTVAKLHLTRNTIASRPDVVASSYHARRQATFKLLVADYCGTGRSFTIPGQILQWKGGAGDVRDAYFDHVPIRGIEARWTAAGASCLSTPRLLETTADIWDSIARECERKPPCAPDDPELLQDAERVSANPGPP